MKGRWYFLHIPKTAGTSFRVALENRFALDEICPHYELQPLMAAHRDRPQGWRLYRGHLGYNLVTLLPFSLRVVTVLRAPEARLLSHFRHIARDPHHPRHRLVAEEGMTLEDFLSDPELARELTNQQARQLGQGVPRDRLQAMLAASDSQQEFARRYRAAIPADEASDQADLERALARLPDLALVGLAEELPTTLARLARLLGGRPPRQVPHLNADPRGERPAFSRRLRSLVEQATWADRILYEKARKLFHEGPPSGWPLPDTAVSPLETKALEITFDQPLEGEGWHQREILPGVGVIRWTGPGRRAELELPLDPARGWSVALEVVRWFDPRDPARLKLWLDDQPARALEARPLEEGAGWLIQGRFEPRWQGGAPRRLVIETPAIHAEADDGRPGGGRRQLGVAVRAVRCRAVD